MALPHTPVYRILIVDGSETGTALTNAFAARHWHARQCHTASMALQLAGLDEYHAIIANVRLPDERGDALVFRIAALQPWLERRAALLVNTPDDARIAAATGYPWHATPINAEALADQLIRIVPTP